MLYYIVVFPLGITIKHGRNKWVTKVCQPLGGLFVIDNFFSAALDGAIREFPAFQYHLPLVVQGIDGDSCHHPGLIALFQYMLDDIAPLSRADPRQGAVRDKRRWNRQAPTDGATALPETDWCIAVETETVIVICA